LSPRRRNFEVLPQWRLFTPELVPQVTNNLSGARDVLNPGTDNIVINLSVQLAELIMVDSVKVHCTFEDFQAACHQSQVLASIGTDIAHIHNTTKV